MVTLISQNLSEFDLHARAILGLPIPNIRLNGPSASAVILADREAERFSIEGIEKALRQGPENGDVEIRIFGKPSTREYRRMGVALASADTVDEALEAARKAAACVQIQYLS
jgi:phosphoribosylglycinamide formyltransferase 2